MRFRIERDAAHVERYRYCTMSEGLETTLEQYLKRFGVLVLGLTVSIGCKPEVSSSSPSSPATATSLPTLASSSTSPTQPTTRQIVSGILLIHERPDGDSQKAVDGLVKTHADAIASRENCRDVIRPSDTRVRETAWFRGFASHSDPVGAASTALFECLSVTTDGSLVRVAVNVSDPADAITLINAIGDTYIKQLVDRRLVALRDERRDLLRELDQEILPKLVGRSSADAAVEFNRKRMALDQSLAAHRRIREEQSAIEISLKRLGNVPTTDEVASQVGKLKARRSLLERVMHLEPNLPVEPA